MSNPMPPATFAVSRSTRTAVRLAWAAALALSAGIGCAGAPPKAAATAAGTGAAVAPSAGAGVASGAGAAVASTPSAGASAASGAGAASGAASGAGAAVASTPSAGAAPTPSASSAPAPAPEATGSMAAAPAPAVASAPAPAAPDGAAAATPTGPAAPAAPLSPRALIADELPYSAAHLRAHEAREARERHHAHESNRETGEREHHRPYHPAPGIVVDVVDAQGGASAADLQRTARNLGYWPLRQCYEDGLRNNQRLSGKVSLELVVSPSGAVDRSTVTATTVRDEMVTACVAREAGRLALPGAAAPSTARVDVSLAAGDEPVTGPRPISNAEPIREALRASWEGARRCYLAALADHPTTGGRMELRIRALSSGEISEVGEVGSTRFGDVDVTRCVLGVYRASKLPPMHARTARDRSFVYALHFESKPGDAPAR
jgi:hypothetical protein